MSRDGPHFNFMCLPCSQVWADVTNDLLSQNNGAGADLLGITGYMSPQGAELESVDLK